MKTIRRTATLLLASALLVVAPPAHAKDQRPCVSKVEYWASVGYPDPRRSAMESRWEVSGLGQAVDLSMFFPWAGAAYEAIAYPRCGYSFDEGWYGILYRTPSTGPNAGQQVATLILQWHRAGATLHGRPRLVEAHP